MTFTLKLQLFCKPVPSVAVQVTGVVPSGKVEPEAEEHKVMRVEQLSVALGEKVTTAPVLEVAVAV